MLQIVQNIIPETSTGRRPGLPLTAKSITIHSTGNPGSTAIGEVKNIVDHDPLKKVSFHYAVDDKRTCQALPDNEMSWHAGDAIKGVTLGPGNMTSISIEICESGDRRKTLLNAVELVKILMKRHNLTIKDLRQHHDWSGKNCPRILRDPAFVKDELDWNWFLKQFEEVDESVEIKPIKVIMNGKPTMIPSINHEGHNYMMIQGLADADKGDKLDVKYDAVNKIVVITSK